MQRNDAGLSLRNPRKCVSANHMIIAKFVDFFTYPCQARRSTWAAVPPTSSVYAFLLRLRSVFSRRSVPTFPLCSTTLSSLGWNTASQSPWSCASTPVLRLHLVSRDRNTAIETELIRGVPQETYGGIRIIFFYRNYEL